MADRTSPTHVRGGVHFGPPKSEDLVTDLGRSPACTCMRVEHHVQVEITSSINYADVSNFDNNCFRFSSPFSCFVCFPSPSLFLYSLAFKLRKVINLSQFDAILLQEFKKHLNHKGVMLLCTVFQIHTLFDFSAKWDPVPTMLTQNHTRTVKGFMGQTTAFKKQYVKSEVLILGENKPANEVRYIHGKLLEGTWTFYGGHDPEDYKHRVNDPETDLSLHPQSPGYRLILNNVLFPAAKKKKRKT